MKLESPLHQKFATGIAGTDAGRTGLERPDNSGTKQADITKTKRKTGRFCKVSSCFSKADD